MEVQHSWSGKKQWRNYWANRDPGEFVTYPRVEALSYDQEVELIRKAQNGDIAARNEVWQRNLRLVLSVANQFSIPLDLMSDALQEGAIGIHRAIAKFDVERGSAFSSYAWPWIWQRIQRFLHCRAYPARVPSQLSDYYAAFRREMLRAGSPHETLEVVERWRQSQPEILPSLVRIHRISTPVCLHRLPADRLPWHDEKLADESIDWQILLLHVFAQLIGRQREIIMRRFALDGRAEATLEELAIQYRITRERVRQIEAQALRRLRRHCREWDFVDGKAAAPGTNDGSASPSETGPAKRRKEIDLDRLLSAIVSMLSHRQRTAVVHYFGILGKPPASISEIALMLGISTRKAAVAVKQARRKLIGILSDREEPRIQRFVERLYTEREWELFLKRCGGCPSGE